MVICSAEFNSKRSLKNATTKTGLLQQLQQLRWVVITCYNLPFFAEPPNKNQRWMEWFRYRVNQNQRDDEKPSWIVEKRVTVGNWLMIYPAWFILTVCELERSSIL
jgi:hypothetical protein